MQRRTIATVTQRKQHHGCSSFINFVLIRTRVGLYIYTHIHSTYDDRNVLYYMYLAASFSDSTSASSLLIRFRHSQRRLSTGISTALNAVWREHTGQRIHFGSGRSFSEACTWLSLPPATSSNSRNTPCENKLSTKLEVVTSVFHCMTIDRLRSLQDRSDRRDCTPVRWTTLHVTYRVFFFSSQQELLHVVCRCVQVSF